MEELGGDGQEVELGGQVQCRLLEITGPTVHLGQGAGKGRGLMDGSAHKTRKSVLLCVLSQSHSNVVWESDYSCTHISSLLHQEPDHFHVTVADGNVQEEAGRVRVGGCGGEGGEGVRHVGGHPPLTEHLVVVAIVAVRGRLVLHIDVQLLLGRNRDGAVPESGWLGRALEGGVV